MTNWNFFDARCKVGLHCKQTTDDLSPYSVDHLLADMDHHGVAEALVLDCLSVEATPKDGNPRILEVAARSPRLHPAWVALPPGTNEMPAPDEMIRQMRQHRVAAVYLLPNQYYHPLTDWCVDDLLGPLAEAGVPLFISPDEIGPGWLAADHSDWPAVVALCKRWPTLPVIVSEFRIRRTQRTLYRAMEACPNLHLELSCYWLHHGIEYLTKRFGSERLLFGSNWPHLGQPATLATVACAEIDDQAKRQIAGDNLRRLIRWCKPEHPKVEPKPPVDELVAWGRTGHRPESIHIHDNHGHLGDSSAHYHVPDGHVDDMVREMDRLGVEQVCVFSLSGVFSDEIYGNNQVIAAIRRHPTRFVGFTMLNPHRGPEAMRRELERCAELGMRGVKLIPSYQGYPEEGPNIDVACQWAHEQRQIILNHYWGGAAQMERLVRTYPDACFFTGHTTTAYAQVMKKYDNLYVCTCPVHPPRCVEEVVAAIGADRFMFGSDLTDLPIAWGLGPILFARISEKEKRLILGGNLRRVLERYSLNPSGATA
ncbi:MAG: amidohydrolase family protein [Phycisphaeraceae bacterium]|nr:amidohydrolase family protein [Phycisphaeraceae bacterium]